jgi:hypothetical protein
VAGQPFFKEFAVRCPHPVSFVNQALLEEYGIVGGYDLGQDYPQLANYMLLCVTEMNTRTEIEELAEALGEIAGMDPEEYGAEDVGQVERDEDADDEIDTAPEVSHA